MRQHEVQAELAGLVEHPFDVGGEIVIALVDVEGERSPAGHALVAAQRLEEQLACEERPQEPAVVRRQRALGRQVHDDDLAHVHHVSQIERARRLADDPAHHGRAQKFEKPIVGA